MAQTYQKKILVLAPECDVHEKMSLSSILNHTQQMGNEHLDNLGITYDKMVEDGMVFLVAKSLITITRRPRMGERIILTTIPKKPKGAQFIRDTVFDAENGERLIEVSIAWLLVEPASHRILRPNAFDVYGFDMYPNEGEYITGYKIKKPQGTGALSFRRVRYTDLDYNLHVNNAVYADIVCDAVPSQVMLSQEIAQFGILYQKEAKLNQEIRLEVIPQQENKEYYIGGQADGGKCFEAQIKFQ